MIPRSLQRYVIATVMAVVFHNIPPRHALPSVINSIAVEKRPGSLDAERRHEKGVIVTQHCRVA
jgi:hypothetical protein